MLRFCISRFLQGIGVILAVLLITFTIVHSAPGGPFQREGKQLSKEELARLNAHYGFDKPLPVQFFNYLKQMVTLDMPSSTTFKGIPVDRIIRQAFPVSMSIGIPALIMSLALGIPLGAAAALRPNSFQDRLSTFAATAGICIPSMVLGPLLALYFGLHRRWFNAAGWNDSSDWVLPSVTLGVIYSSYVARLMRGSLRETLVQDFIRTARAKGASEAAVVMRHAMKLACLPVLNFLGPAAAGIITGSIVVERVFQIPGLGQHFVSSAVNGDFNLALTIAAFFAALITLFNFVVDVIQALLNPRIGFAE